MRYLSRYRWFLTLFLLISLLFFAVRLPNLTSQPIFVDEAIYIRWSQLMKSDAALRFVSMTDGKTPFYMWTLIPFLKVFDDPLYAGRLLSVLAGFTTLLGVAFLSFYFFNSRIALWASLLVAITPFILFFDRMALVDAMLSAGIVWTLCLLLLLQRHARLDLSMLAGLTAGISILVKTPGLIIGYLMPLSFIAMPLKGSLKKNFFRRAGLLLLVFIIMQVIFNLLRLGPGFENLHSRDQDYIFTVGEVISHPLNPLLGNINRVFNYSSFYIGFVLMVLILYGGFVTIKKLDRNGLAVMLWGIFSILIAASFIKPFTARYILFAIPPLLIIASIAIDDVYQKFIDRKSFILPLLIIVIASYPAYFIFNSLKDPFKTPLRGEEYSGYFREWTAGVGLREIAAYLQTKTQEGTVVVGTEGAFGTLPDGLQIYFDKNDQIVFQGGAAVITDGLRTAAKDHQAFFVAHRSRFDGKDIAGIELIKEYGRPARADGTHEAILLFKVYPLTTDQATNSAKLK